MSKCPACNTHELHDSAWISESDGAVWKSDDHYDCANCGPMPKDYVNAVQARIEYLIKWVQHDCPYSREEILGTMERELGGSK